MRQRLKSRMKPRGRPHLKQRRTLRLENLGFLLAFTTIDFFAMLVFLSERSELRNNLHPAPCLRQTPLQTFPYVRPSIAILLKLQFACHRVLLSFIALDVYILPRTTEACCRHLSTIVISKTLIKIFRPAKVQSFRSDTLDYIHVVHKQGAGLLRKEIRVLAPHLSDVGLWKLIRAPFLAVYPELVHGESVEPSKGLLDRQHTC
jgi:hypothetical protein